MLAHHRAIRALRETASHPDDRLGVVLNVIPARPADPENPDDVRVAGIADDIHNRLFLDTTFFGTYPDSIRELHRRFGVDDRVDIAEMERRPGRHRPARRQLLQHQSFRVRP
jgi:beta-glucosidase/6-phospho-beta-glucosidase/beta-galactosidase